MSTLPNDGDSGDELSLSVFAVVSLAAPVHRTWSGWRRALPVAGFLECVAAAATLAVHLWRTARRSLWLVGGIAAALLLIRAACLLVGAADEVDPEA